MSRKIDWVKYNRQVLGPLDRLPTPLRRWYCENSILGCPQSMVSVMHQMLLQGISYKEIADAVMCAELDAVLEEKQGADRESISTPTPQDDAKTKAAYYFDAQTARQSKDG